MCREKLLPSSLRDATRSPFCRLCDIFPRPGEVFLSEGGFGSTAKFSVLTKAPSLRELDASETSRLKEYVCGRCCEYCVSNIKFNKRGYPDRCIV